MLKYYIIRVKTSLILFDINAKNGYHLLKAKTFNYDGAEKYYIKKLHMEERTVGSSCIWRFSFSFIFRSKPQFKERVF